jgi:hypothetical protein
MRRVLVVTVMVFTGLLTAPGSAQQQTAEIQKILLDTALWGRDFPALLAQLPAMIAAGETILYVFPDRAAGGRAFPTVSDAQPAIQRTREAVAKPVQFQPALAALQKQAVQPAGGPLRLEAARVVDADGFHIVALRTGDLQLLAPGLTIAAVRARLGPPGQVTRRTIHAQGDSKPTVLTLHSYVGGAIAFAESNMEEAGVVERVVLNLSAVSPAVIR